MERLLPLLSVLGLGLAGCRAQPYVRTHIEALNAEYRQLEDYVYALEEENARLNAELQSLRAQRSSPSDSAPPSRGLFRSRPAPSSRGSSSSGSSGGDNSDGLELPQIEIPTNPAPHAAPSGGVPAGVPKLPTAPSQGRTDGGSRGAIASSGDPKAALSREDQEEAPEDIPPKTPVPSATPSPPFLIADRLSAASAPAPTQDRHGTSAESPTAVARVSAARSTSPPARLVLDPQLCRGADWDGRPGDDGLQLVVQAFTAKGEEALLAGKLAIVVLDPSRQGDAARLARWDFDAAATAQLVAASPPSSRGLKLDLPWPGDPPTSNRLAVFVRLEMEDGRRLETNRELFIIPPGQTISGWTPRAQRRDVTAQSFGSQVTVAGHQIEGGEASSAGGDLRDAAGRNFSAPPELPKWSPAR